MKKLLFVALFLLGIVFINGCVGIEDQIEIPPDTKDKDINSGTFIEISLSGGGIGGGINPGGVDRIIKNNGEVLVVRYSLYDGETRKSFSITRTEVEDLAQFILDKGFFEMQDVYDCDKNDQECEMRKDYYPPAVPLSININIGDRSKKVVVTVYEEGMVDYPKELEEIINKINEIINQANS